MCNKEKMINSIELFKQKSSSGLRGRTTSYYEDKKDVSGNKMVGLTPRSPGSKKIKFAKHKDVESMDFPNVDTNNSNNDKKNNNKNKNKNNKEKKTIKPMEKK